MVGQAPNMTVAVEKVDEVHFDIKTTNTLNARAAYEEAFELDLHQNYAFDVAGALHMPAVVDRGTLHALNRTLDGVEEAMHTRLLYLPAPAREPFRELLVQPQVVATLNQLIGSGYRLNPSHSC